MSDKSFTISGYMKISGRKSNYGGYSGSIDSFTKSKPGLTSNQIAVFIQVKVPIAFFERLTPVIEIELPEEAVVNPNIQSVIKLSALEIADKLRLDVNNVEDGLQLLIQQKAHPLRELKLTEPEEVTQ